jgi:hypothetical protein
VNSRRSWSASFASALAALAFGSALRAAEPAPATREYRVEFQADRVQIEGDLGSLELDGNVTVQAQGYRLKSQHLELRRGPHGVEADGSAAVAFCTCDRPPVTLRVAHATLAPPTDALFTNLRLEVWDVPVLWLPGLWLRAPTRPGLTFPRLSYRGDDGFLAGAGAYFPLALSEGRVTRSLTVNAGAYLLHGARLEGEVDTEAGSSRLAWDYLRQSALEIDAHGSAVLSEATLAYRVDAWRGARARVESSSLDVAARRTDRANLSLAQVDDLALAFGLRADAPRGGAISDLGAIGPELYLGAARALGENAACDLSAWTATSRTAGNHSQTALLERGTLTANLRPGLLGVRFSAAQSGALNIEERRSTGLLRAGLEARVGMPLTRDFGSLTHFVEPALVLRGLVDAAPRGSELNAESRLLVAGGVDSALGQRATRQALNLAVRVGALRHAGAADLVGMTRTSADAHALGVSQSFGLIGAGASVVSLSRLRLGAADGLHVRVRGDGASHGSPAQARVLFDEAWFDPARPFLDRNGWSAGSEVSVPWSRALTTTASLDYDLTGRDLLSVWGSLGYRYSCGCLAVAGYLGHRVGRGGVDAWIGFDLAP